LSGRRPRPPTLAPHSALATGAKNAGIDVTTMPSLSNSSPQSAFTPVVNQMKQDGSNWSDNGLTAQDPPPMRLANGTGPKAISPIALGPFARSHGGRLPQAPWRRAQLEGGSNRDGQ